MQDAQSIDIWKTDSLEFNNLTEGKIVILGGGLIDNVDFDQNIIAISNSKFNKLIIWGAGFNRHFTESSTSKIILSKADLIGIRDWDFGYDWVPCPSCMHPIFDKKNHNQK